VQALAERLGVGSAAQMAQGIVDVATAQMADAIREISIERGYDPADFTLMAFGGAGPMHAVQVAEELGMTRVLIPVFPGNLSALGLLASDQRHELVQTFYSRLAGLEREALAAVLHAQRSEGSRILAGQGFPMERVAFAHALDMRYARQGFELTVAVNTDPLEPAAFQQAFLEAYTARFGQADATGAIEIVNVRTTVIGRTPKPELPRLERSARLADAAIGQHPVVVSGETLQAAVYERARLPLDERLAGPAIVEEEGATTVVLPGWSAGLDRFGNLHLRAET
jgi:N-methylhydantoinase A